MAVPRIKIKLSSLHRSIDEEDDGKRQTDTKAAAAPNVDDDSSSDDTASRSNSVPTPSPSAAAKHSIYSPPTPSDSTVAGTPVPVSEALDNIPPRLSMTSMDAPATPVGKLPRKSLTKKRKLETPTPRTAPRKKPLSIVLEKWLDTLTKRDSYGFFLRPVDITLVTDYLAVIKEPMDFSTMARRLRDGLYTTVDVFLQDFYLICNNAKLYNAPSTVYYRAADRLWSFGQKMIERERDTIADDVEEYLELKARAQREMSEVASLAGGETSFVDSPNPADLSSSLRFVDPKDDDLPPALSTLIKDKTATKKKKMELQSGPYLAPDGSTRYLSDSSVVLPKARPYGSVPSLTIISSRASEYKGPKIGKSRFVKQSSMLFSKTTPLDA